MEFTINCTRVPIPQGTTLYGIPVEVGPAPASPGSVSYLGASFGDSNDGAVLNRFRQAAPDTKEPVPKPLRNCVFNHRDNTIISSFNTRTLTFQGRLAELTNNATMQNIDVIAVQEHRFYHPNNTIKYHTIESYNLITSSSHKNSSNASIGGVGFLLSPRALNNLLSVESISQRILVIELSGNPKTTIICVYSPHNSSPIDEVEQFYETLKQTIEQIPLHNFLVIAGDFNAQLGSEDVKFAFNPETNRNGELLKDLLNEFNLFSSNNNFMKPSGQLWTFK